MTALLKPRAYQVEAIAALHDAWASGQRRQAVVLPTASGKTVVFAHLTSQFVDTHGKRAVVLVHSDELVTQAVNKIRAVAPHLPVGIVKAEKDEVDASIVVASVQTLRQAHRLERLTDIGLLIVDEAHHATAESYLTIMEHYGAFWPDGDAVKARPFPLVAGFTATLARADKACLGDVWQGVAYRRDITWMIRRQYLVDVRGKRIKVDDLELNKVRKSGGDFAVGDLGDHLQASLAPETVAKAYVEHAADRRGILFAPTVSAAQAFATALNDQGIRAEVVHGKLPKDERRAILARLHNGETQVVCNCMVLTEGFDSPRVSCVVVARPTRSAPLYVQMVGRGLRVDPEVDYEQQDCLVLDVVGASAVHGLATLVDLSPKRIALTDDQTLTAAEDAYDADIEARGVVPLDTRPEHRGPVYAVDFDPVALASSKVWNRTSNGTYFLSAGTGDGGLFIFLWQTPDGTYDVVWAIKGRPPVTLTAPGRPENGQRGGFTEHRDLPLDMAFGWGEILAEDLGGHEAGLTLDRQRAWRRTLPSEKQLQLAANLRIDVPPGSSKGDVGFMIDAVFASRRIDPLVAFFAANTQKGLAS